jgi:hypothetical protein
MVGRRLASILGTLVRSTTTIKTPLVLPQVRACVAVFFSLSLSRSLARARSLSLNFVASPSAQLWFIIIIREEAHA